MGNKVALHNLGCKVNAYEIEAMQQLLEEAGYEIVPFEPGADIYVINTCTVTNIKTDAPQSQKNESGSDRGGNGLLCTDRWRETGKRRSH